jgi:transcriptional regulator with XRE-family HTH domain
VTITPSSSAKQARETLGARLRELRKDAGLSARALAAATGQHFTRVSKIEHGVQAPADHDIRDWCRACAAEEQIPDLIATARAVESSYLEFRRQARSGMRRVLGPHTVQLYEDTQLFRVYEHNVIPGLFQTAEYAEAMLSFWIGFLDIPNDIQAAVAARMERQHVIYLRDKQFSVMSLPTVTLGIIPLMKERAGIPSTGFWIFDGSLAALETPTASIEVTRPQEIGLYARMFGYLQAEAVYGQEARGLITGILHELAQLIATS